MKFELDANSLGRTAKGDTLLDAIAAAQVFYAWRTEDGRFEIREQCAVIEECEGRFSASARLES